MRLEISCQDRLGIVQDILDILVNLNIDLRGIEIAPGGKIFVNFPNIAFSDFQRLMPKIRRIDGIDDVVTTPFMPLEREHNELMALINTLPDPVFSIDRKGRVQMSNEAGCNALEMGVEQLQRRQISDLIYGFGFERWLEQSDIQAQAQKVRFIEQDFLADLLPVLVPDTEDNAIVAGAVIILRSEFRLGQQLSQFHQSRTDSFSSILASGNAMKCLVRQARCMAGQDAPMLLFGEVGTGKELIARACHAASRYSEKEFLRFNCASTDQGEIEQQLFGDHGVFRQEKVGTLFLNQVDKLPFAAQSKLLQVLQQQMAGSAAYADVRVICATHQDLGALVEQGAFGQDLYYHLNVLSLIVPPLRERKSDIIALAERFVRQHSIKLGNKIPKLSKSCVEHLRTYPWPGNVLQLENALFRALAVLEGNELKKEHLQVPSCAVSQSVVATEFDGSLETAVKGFEKDILQRLYPSYPSTRQLAKKLGLSHTAIANKLREYGINKKQV